MHRPLEVPVGMLAATGGTVALSVLVLAGCAADAPRGLPDERPTVTRTSPLPGCPAGVAVPPTTVTATPGRHTPPTVILRTGGAVSFPLPADSTFGVFGSGADTAGAVLCQAASAPTGHAVLVVRGAGYVRVAVLDGRPADTAVVYVRTS